MPLHGAGVFLLERLHDAEHEPEHGQRADETRRPDDELIPDRLVLAQRREVEEVGMVLIHARARPCRVVTIVTSRARRDVQLGAALVVDAELVERQLAALDQRPLVDPFQRRDMIDLVFGDARKSAGIGSRLRERCAFHHLAGIGEHGGRIAATEAIGGSSHDRQQHRATRSFDEPGCGGFSRRQAHTRQIEIGKLFESHLRREHGRRPHTSS